MEAPLSDAAQFNQLIQWAFYGVATFLGSIGVGTMMGMRRSVEELNKNVAIVIVRVDTHEKRLDRHDEILDEVKTS